MAREFPKSICYCFIDYAKAFDCVDHNKLLKKWEYQTPLTTSWETCLQNKKQQLEPCMKQLTGSKLGKEYIKAAYCYPAYLTSMQSTSCKMPGLVTHKLESRLLGDWRLRKKKKDFWEKYQPPQICRWYRSHAESEQLKSVLMRVKEKSEKAGFKLNIQKTKIWHWSHYFMANRWGKSRKQWQILFPWGPKYHCRQ